MGRSQSARWNSSSLTGQEASTARIMNGAIIMANLFGVGTASIIKKDQGYVISIMHTGTQKHGSALTEKGVIWNDCFNYIDYCVNSVHCGCTS